jgi:hypothetical protein
MGEVSKEEIYDLALTLGIKDPAVLFMGPELIVGEWVNLAECEGEEHLVIRSKHKGIRIIVRAPGTKSAAHALREWSRQRRTG